MKSIINWDKVQSQSTTFKNSTPFKFAFIEEFIDRKFYEKLYETYPVIDDTWDLRSDFSKHQYAKHWSTEKNSICYPGDDSNFSQYWNEFKRYCESDEFINNLKTFSGIPISKFKHIVFTSYKQGGFQLPHIHNVGPSTIIMMVYFSKNWKQGSPGGTFMATEENEDSIVFEPYNLDNSVALFQDSPKSSHGVRYISENVTRQGIQIMFEGYSETTGWSGGTNDEINKQRAVEQIEL
tara:strand:- start:111 stop:821 length:711 start_codon:yes stop_codon:yes gene_type:complete